MNKRFFSALVLFAVLIALVWTTMGYAPVEIEGRKVDVRWIPTLIIGLFAFLSWTHYLRSDLEDVGKRGQ